MKRPGDWIFWGMIAATVMTAAHLPLWAHIASAFAVGWYFNEREGKRRQ